ncbi:MAG: DNA methyltransferase [Clostridia bacterium]|nr:DNA methyltransferase [Clostridiales bacterium]MBO5004563.1 DNA methyltransferase [Clostridia bacterium]
MKVDIYDTDKKYNIIYADPPWHYKTWRDGKGTANNYYPTMKIENIIAMKDTIQKISDENCVLFLWVTFPCLIEGLRILLEWGFKYKTCGFTWVKRNKVSDTWFFGLGHWTRANAELCLIATKGKIKRVSNKVSQIVDTRIEEHSKKPAIVRDRIVELIGDLPRIELFARQTADGWDCWGNEI